MFRITFDICLDLYAIQILILDLMISFEIIEINVSHDYPQSLMFLKLYRGSFFRQIFIEISLIYKLHSLLKWISLWKMIQKARLGLSGSLRSYF